ncbi:MAG: hypothetical protein P8Y28_13335, partial [Gammaproteobacteria bacterium]
MQKQNSNSISEKAVNAKALVFTNAELDSPGKKHEIGAGQVILYSKRSPHKQTENEDSLGVFILGEHDCAIAV